MRNLKNIIDLFEPKYPPINLRCLPPAYFFYRNRADVEIQAAAPIRSNRGHLFEHLYHSALIYR